MTAIADTTRITEIEQSLQTTWDEALLAVYADALQAAGDPRGELIAIDLHIAAHGRTREIEERRRDRLYAWLGGRRLSGVGCDAPWHTRRFIHGLYDDFRPYEARYGPEYVARLLGSSAGRYLRGASVQEPVDAVDGALLRFAAHDHPWLQRLRVGTTSGTGPAVEAGTAARLVRAAPHLRTLALSTRAFEAMPFHHPAVRRLELIEVSPQVRREVLDPCVTELALVRMPYQSEEIRRLLAAFPGLRRLEVAPHDPDDPLWRVSLRELPEGITSLCIPPPSDQAGREQLLAGLEERPSMRVELGGGYAGSAAGLEPLRHPRIVEHPLRPWPRYPAFVAVHVAGQRIPLHALVDAMEACYERLDDAERATWCIVWDAIWRSPTTIESATLIAAIEVIREDLPSSNRATVAPVLKALRLKSTVQLRVISGRPS